jgi:geranylgeranyl diphosphate synthase type I
MRYSESVEATLRGLFSSHKVPLYNMMEYQLGWREEQGEVLEYPHDVDRLYSTLCVLSCKAMGGDPNDALPAASALELLENFFQVHADIQDGNQERNGIPAVWWVWGPGQAINVGDAFQAFARLSLLQQKKANTCPDEILKEVKILDEACLRACEGLHLELTYQERVDITVEMYHRMARERNGALVGCAFELGALASGMDVGAAKVIRGFGEDLGMAYRIREELLDLWGATATPLPRNTGFLNKKKSLPIVYAFEEGPIAQKRALGNFFFKRVLELTDIPGVIDILDTVGAKAYAHREVDRLFEAALSRLDNITLSSEGRRDLEMAARFLAFG